MLYDAGDRYHLRCMSCGLNLNQLLKYSCTMSVIVTWLNIHFALNFLLSKVTLGSVIACKLRSEPAQQQQKKWLSVVDGNSESCSKRIVFGRQRDTHQLSCFFYRFVIFNEPIFFSVWFRYLPNKQEKKNSNRSRSLRRWRKTKWKRVESDFWHVSSLHLPIVTQISVTLEKKVIHKPFCCLLRTK